VTPRADADETPPSAERRRHLMITPSAEYADADAAERRLRPMKMRRRRHALPPPAEELPPLPPRCASAR